MKLILCRRSWIYWQIIWKKSIDTDALLQLAREAPTLDEEADRAAWEQTAVKAGIRRHKGNPLRIGLARDEAFCFFYEDNLQLLRELGAELVEFSPIHDSCLPDALDGLLLHGGYPELYGRELEANVTMRNSIRNAIDRGLPAMAECGGFLYLHRSLKDSEGKTWEMAGVLTGEAFYTGHLNRFGYMTLTEGRMFGQEMGEIRSHEFHYYESDDPGSEFFAQKPTGNRSWRCIRSWHAADSRTEAVSAEQETGAKRELTAGFPHLYYHAAPQIAAAFLRQAEEWHGKTAADGRMA